MIYRHVLTLALSIVLTAIASAEQNSVPAVTTMPANLAVTQRDDEIEFRSRYLRIAVARHRPAITALCWDSLGEGHVDVNLLKSGPEDGGRFTLTPAGVAHADATINSNVVRYALDINANITAQWEIRVDPKTVEMSFRCMAAQAETFEQPPGLRLAFTVEHTPIAPLAMPRPGASAPLPCILHASDYGSLLINRTDNDGGVLKGESIRPANQWNATILPGADDGTDHGYELKQGESSWRLKMSVESVQPLPELTGGDPRLAGFPRHWLNTFQYRPDLGILSNNIVSDNAVFCLFTFTDPAVFTPTLPGGIDAIQLARESLDRYLAGAGGYGVGSEIFMDCNPALLISAWDVIRVTGDLKLLDRWLPKLEALAAHTQQQDRNGNGLPESTRSGNRGDALETQNRTGNWWDCINFGHEDAYCCALTYRAFRGLADLERLAGRGEQARQYEGSADRIRDVYLPTFLNPKTGLLAGWRSRDGELHDYAFAFVNGMAITYGLVPTQTANTILDRIEAKLQEVKYTRFDLGLPGNLVPIPKDDYIVDVFGAPKKADGSDSFGVFENGGATACYAYFYIQALYQLGRREQADRILWPMMQTYARGGFQNGIPHAGEWRRWDGSPSGYEGFLADAYYSQMAVFTGYYGITFTSDGFQLASWSPLKGKPVRLGLKYMGKLVENIR